MRKRIFWAGNSSRRSSREKIRGPRRETSAPGPTRHFVYMLECSDGSLYSGYTTDPARRLAQHSSGRAARYTRSRLPVKLVFLQELPSRGEALSRELRLKRLKKEEKLLLCRGYLGLEKHGSR